MGKAALAGLDQTQALKRAVLGAILRNPVANLQFFYPDVDPRRPDSRDMWDWAGWHPDHFLRVCKSQLPLAHWAVGLFVCGRGIGKTELFANADGIRRAIVYPNARVVGMTQLSASMRAHLSDPTSDWIERHPIWSLALDTVSRDDERPRVTFLNGSRLDWLTPGRQDRGTPRARKLQGLRATSTGIDEAQNFLYMWLRTAQQQRLLARRDAEAQRTRGVSHRMTGVPDGRRDTPFYEYDTAPESPFRAQLKIDGRMVVVDLRWHCPSPAVRYYTRQRHEENLSDYRCDPARDVWTQDYLRDCWAQHGRAAAAFFPTEVREQASVNVRDWREVSSSPLPFQQATAAVGGFDPEGRLQTPSFAWLDGQLPVELPGHTYGLGIDVGIADSTCIAGFYRNEEQAWVWQWLLSLKEWRNTTWQCWVVHYLMERYRPQFVGVDQSTLGHAIYDPLVNSTSFALTYAKMSDVLHGFTTTQRYCWGRRDGPGRLTGRESPDELDHQLYPVWTMAAVYQHLMNRTILLPLVQQAEQVHGDLAKITRTVVANPQGGLRTEFGPKHPHRVSAVQCFVGALRQWESRPQPEVVPDGRMAAECMRQILQLKMPPLFGRGDESRFPSDAW